MKYFDDLNKTSASFAAKEHRINLGNSDECKVYFHIHPSAELLLVLSGELILHFPGKESERIPAGSCAMLLPFQSHAYDRPAGAEYFRFNFMPSLVRTFFTSNEKRVGKRAVFDINISEYLPFLESIREGKISLYKVKGFLYNMLGDYERQIPFIKTDANENVLSRVISYINSNTTEKLTLSSIAQALGYNEKYLSRCINQSAGFSFSTLITILRMEAASNLLKNTNRTIVDIAMECGFGSERSFYRSFKEFTGYTPNEFRASPKQKLVINDITL